MCSDPVRSHPQSILYHYKHVRDDTTNVNNTHATTIGPRTRKRDLLISFTFYRREVRSVGTRRVCKPIL